MYDIIIIGAGYVGLTAALALRSLGLKILVIEKRNLKIQKRPGEPSRLLAIASASCQIFRKYGLTQDFNLLGQPIKKIQVQEADTENYLVFDPKDIQHENFGYMVEEHLLHKALFDKTKLDIIESADIISISQDKFSCQLTLNDGREFTAKLCLVSDGKNSEIRDILGIETRRHNYNQNAVVCDLSHERNHNGTALERFLPTGPFGILPKKDGYTSSIVWSVDNDYVKTLKSMDKKVLLSLIKERFGEQYGELNFASDVKYFPLELVQAKSVVNGKFVLIGDSAHAIHPLAGQGLNLSIRDVDNLVTCIKRQIELGLDIGSSIMLEEYENSRKFDNNLMIESTHGLNYLFSNNFLPVKLIRSKGLSIVNRIMPLKRIFMRYACGHMN